MRRLSGLFTLVLGGLLFWSAYGAYHAAGWPRVLALPAVWQAQIAAWIAPGLQRWALPSGVVLALAGLILRYAVFGRFYGAARRLIGGVVLTIMALVFLGLAVWFAVHQAYPLLIACVVMGVGTLGIAWWRPRVSWRW